MQTFERLCDDHYDTLFHECYDDHLDKETQKEIENLREEDAIERIREQEREEKKRIESGYYDKEPFIWTDEMEEQLREHLKNCEKGKK